jgi:hypothetical protein
MTSLAADRRGAFYAALIIHCLGPAGPDCPLGYVTRWIETEHPHVRVRTDLQWCPDCDARPSDTWVDPASLPPGYSFAVVIAHDDRCPWLSAHLRRQGGAQ